MTNEVVARALNFVSEVESDARRRIAKGEVSELLGDPLLHRAYEDLRDAAQSAMWRWG